MKKLFPLLGVFILLFVSCDKPLDQDEPGEEFFERQALSEFYQALGGSDWKNNSNWCGDKPINEWYGVTVSGLDAERRISVSLPANRLIGTIPDSFWEKLPLLNVDLSSNLISGDLSSAVSLMEERPELTVDLSYNSFSGTVPEALGRYLDRLHIYGNFFSGAVPSSALAHPQWIKWWTNILFQRGGIPMDSDNLVIPGPRIIAKDLDGRQFDADSEYADNELTVICCWDKSYTTRLLGFKKYYDDFRIRGLNLISWNPKDTDAEIRKVISGKEVPWRNVEADYTEALGILPPKTILAVDKKGEIIYKDFTGSADIYDFIDSYLVSSEDYVSTDFSQDGKVYKLKTATEGNGINVVLMGDGYSDRMIACGKYREVMESAMEYLFVEEPYKSFEHLFNVYMVNAVSAGEIIDGTTVFGTRFGESTWVEGDDQKVFTYARKALTQSQMDEATIVVMQNSQKYAGTCWMYYPAKGDYGSGSSISYFPIGVDDEAFRKILNHETCGHGFPKLGDEYAYERMGQITQKAIDDAAVLEPSGWYRNISFTSDPSAVKWTHFLTDSRYSGQGLGVFEGGLSYWTGVWRPTEVSIMRHNTGGFNAPSREAIYYRIHKLAYGDSWVYDYEDFVEYDAINRTSAAAVKFKAPLRPDTIPHAAPVVVNRSWREVVGE